MAASATGNVSKKDLGGLIKAAASGDESAARRLISPFVTADEKLLAHGISAKFGLISTYDFLFLTDQRIGDLQITPFTGDLNVEVAYLRNLDAFVLSQPAFPLLLRLGMALCYPLLPLFAYGSVVAPTVDAGLTFVVSQSISIGVALLVLYLVHAAINPAIRRVFLRFMKSGLFCKLRGSPIGVLIFADRNKFEMLTSVTRLLTNAKKQLDNMSDA